MLKRNLWKILLSVLIAAWAVSELVPLNDIPFVTYARDHATARHDEFVKLLDEAGARKAANRAPSEFVALKQIGTERKIDLTVFFPDIRLESTLHNITKRNTILLNELLLRSKGKLQRGLDLAGGVAVTLEVDPKVAGKNPQDIEKEKLGKAIEIISSRVNAFGVAEPLIRAVGDNRIEVELPGLNTKNNPEIVDEVKAPALLEFRIVHPTLSPATSAPGEIPPGYEPLNLSEDDRGGQEVSEDLFVKRIPEATGEIISKAYPHQDLYGKPEILMQFTNEGRKKFAAMTKAISDEGKRTGRPGRLAIVLDGKLYSAPLVHDEIDNDSAVIEGQFTDREAINLSNVLNNPLDLPLVVKEQYEVGPSLAEDAISSGVKASIIGTAAVAAFMIVFYATGGLVAVGTLAINIMIILGVMASFHATMTLPGLAGIVLTIGMAVDANVLIFERIREESAKGKSLKGALAAGYARAFSTIFDSHVTTLISSIILIYMGTGTVKGFGVSLTIGVAASLFTALVVTRLVFDFLINRGIVKTLPMFHLIRGTKINFMKIALPMFVATWTLIIVGCGYGIFARGVHVFGTDFLGGDNLSLAFTQKVEVEQVRKVLTAEGVKDPQIQYQREVTGTAEKLRITTAFNTGTNVLSALQKHFPTSKFSQASLDKVGPTIGKEIQKTAIIAILLSLFGILIYVAFRYELPFGVGAVFALVHDVLLTIGVYCLSGREFNATTVAAILTIIGFSTNDTIVIFDRIREDLKLGVRGSFKEIIDQAINQTLSRTLITSGTVFIATMALFLFGGGAINDFAFIFLIGILTGTYSSIYMASALVLWWHKGERPAIGTATVATIEQVQA